MIYIPKNKRRILFEKIGHGKEDMFLFLLEDFIIKTDQEEYPNSIFLFKNGEVWFEIYQEQDEKNGYFWCSYEHYWSVFEKEFGLNYTEIQDFTKDMVERHFKMKQLTPKKLGAKFVEEVERHFKMKQLTPLTMSRISLLTVERHFKMKQLTPGNGINYIG